MPAATKAKRKGDKTKGAPEAHIHNRLMPKGWYGFTEAEDTCADFGIDSMVSFEGAPAVCVDVHQNPAEGGVWLAQDFPADNYGGKRIRLTGYMKTEDVSSGAALYLQTMGARRTILTFDNMGNRLVTDSTDWTKYELVIDVPSEADNISMGAILRGTGRLYVAGLHFDEVGKDIETTDQYSFGCRGIWCKEPGNLDFKLDEDVQEHVSNGFAGKHPKNWFRWGSEGNVYHVGADVLIDEAEQLVGCIKSVKDVDDFQTAMLFQKFDGTPYRDQRVRFSAQTKCAGISYRCGLELGVMDIYSQDLFYRNTFAKHENTDWRPSEVVIDVPSCAGVLQIGAQMHGAGSFWFKDLKFEVVDRSVAVTQNIRKDTARNLDFAIIHSENEGKNVCGAGIVGP